MEMSPNDAVKLSFYNGIRKTPNKFLFILNMWATYGFLYKKFGEIKTYFNDHRLRNVEQKRKILFRLACSNL